MCRIIFINMLRIISSSHERIIWVAAGENVSQYSIRGSGGLSKANSQYKNRKIEQCRSCGRVMDLIDQLKKLLRIYCTGTKFIPSQLYHDIQRMVQGQGSYFVRVLLQNRGGGKLYLYQVGTDQLEKVFNTVRTITHARNCDVLELCQRLLHGEERYQ